MDLRNGVTIGAMVEETAAKYPGRNAVEFLGQTWTYEQLNRITDDMAVGLLHLGVEKQQKAGIWANDRPNSLFVLLALEKIGAVPVLFNTSWHPREMISQMEAADVEYLFFDEGFKDTDFVDVCRTLDMPGLKIKVYIGLTPETFEDEKVLTLDRLLACGSPNALTVRKSQVKDTDIDMILFTSGSTSEPKGVLTTHFSRVNIGFAQAQMIHATCEDVYCVAIPMFHCFSMGGNIMAALAVGACICFPKNRRTDSIFMAVQNAGCTVLTAVPTLYSALLANKNRKNYDISTLRTGLIGGAACRPELFAAVYKELGAQLLPSLGQTEATAGITCGRYEDTFEQNAESAGYFIEHIEGKISDIITGKTLGCGQNGEVCIRGYNVMQGYYKQPELTARTIDADGFLHTGDMGYLDEDGRLYLTGRLKELIIRGGENIAPLEVENAIGADARVAQVKVIGVPDSHYGEEVCACVQCEKGTKMTEEEVKDLVKSRLASYKVPKYVVFLETMPLLGNGKIDTAALKKMEVWKI